MEVEVHHDHLNKRQRRAKVIADTRSILVRKFPAAFRIKGAAKVPLAVGIHTEIAARCPDLPMTRITRALSDYTGGPTYLGAIIEGAPRVDLDGKTVRTVTDREAAYAKTKATRLAAIWDDQLARRRAKAIEHHPERRA